MKFMRFLTVGAIVLLGAFATTITTSAQTTYAVRTVNRVQLLSRPSPDGTVVATLDAGTVVDVIDRDAEWLSVSLRSAQGAPRRGWIRAADAESTIFIPPSAEDIRRAQAQRERVEQARQEVERRTQEYEAALHPRDGADAQAPQTPTFKRSGADHPMWDVSGGYTLLFDNSDSLTFPLGWMLSAGRTVNDRVSIVGEVSGSYKSADLLGITLANANVHTFTAGPRYSTATNGLLLYGQFLAGFDISHGSVLGYSASSAGFAMEPGFGADFPFTKTFAIRIGGDVPIIHDSGSWFGGFRLTTGLTVLSKR